jgi:UDPglucose--hexose-1-phosphate uridylyltransferase
VPTPRHVVTLGALTPDELSGAMRIWALRLARVGRDERGLWPFCFVNEGAAAGASLQHSHAQVVGLPAAPPRMVAREAAFAGGANPIRDDLREAGERLVVEADGLVAWCPEVPPFTGTVRIAPREPAPDLDGADFGAAATLLLDVLARIGAALGEPALNLLVHQRRAGRTDPYHWHMDVIPRLGTLAGLELGTGVVAIAQAPVGIAQRLRGAPG